MVGGLADVIQATTIRDRIIEQGPPQTRPLRHTRLFDNTSALAPPVLSGDWQSVRTRSRNEFWGRSTRHWLPASSRSVMMSEIVSQRVEPESPQPRSVGQARRLVEPTEVAAISPLATPFPPVTTMRRVFAMSGSAKHSTAVAPSGATIVSASFANASTRTSVLSPTASSASPTSSTTLAIRESVTSTQLSRHRSSMLCGQSISIGHTFKQTSPATWGVNDALASPLFCVRTTPDSIEYLDRSGQS